MRNANVCIADKRVGDLESVRKEFMRIIVKNLPESELERCQ